MIVGVVLEAVAPSHMQADIWLSKLGIDIVTRFKQIGLYVFRTIINIVQAEIRGDDVLSIIKQRLDDMPTDITAGSSDQYSFNHTYRVYQRGM